MWTKSGRQWGRPSIRGRQARYDPEGLGATTRESLSRREQKTPRTVQWIAPTPTLNLRSRYGTLPAQLPDGRKNRRDVNKKQDATTSGQAESDRE